jgi:hypothetical protein
MLEHDVTWERRKINIHHQCNLRSNTGWHTQHVQCKVCHTIRCYYTKHSEQNKMLYQTWVTSSPLYGPKLVENECVTTVVTNYIWENPRKKLDVSAPNWVGHHQVIILFQPDDGPLNYRPKHIVVFRDFPKYSCVRTVITHSFSTSSAISTYARLSIITSLRALHYPKTLQYSFTIL